MKSVAELKNKNPGQWYSSLKQMTSFNQQKKKAILHKPKQINKNGILLGGALIEFLVSRSLGIFVELVLEKKSKYLVPRGTKYLLFFSNTSSTNIPRDLETKNSISAPPKSIPFLLICFGLCSMAFFFC